MKPSLLAWTSLWVFLLGFGDALSSSGYFYKTNKGALGLIKEFTVTSSRTFLSSTTNPRIVEFYSPSCVSSIVVEEEEEDLSLRLSWFVTHTTEESLLSRLLCHCPTRRDQDSSGWLRTCGSCLFCFRSKFGY